MKKALPVVLVLVLLFTASFLLVACAAKEATVVDYYVDYPYETNSTTVRKTAFSYKSGETFSNTGIKIVCVLSDKTEKYLPTDKADVTQIVYSDELKALLDDDNKFVDVTEIKNVTLTVTFLDEAPITVNVTVRPKA